ncbi:MAG: YjjG family noncanonical pyrimidine nucleotidase [Flavobacterium sp.]|jgi:YjjG family noncanonical pyrimidine nucleotidase
MKDKITDVFFDLDHTLWDFEKNSALTFEKVFHLNSLDLDMNRFLEIYIPINFEYWERFRKEEISAIQLRYGRLKDTFDTLQFEVSDDLINTLSGQYIQYLPDFNYLYDGTFEILDYLKTNYKLHIITNGFQDVQDGKIRNSNLHPYFQSVTNSENAGFKKPNPKIFEFALTLSKANKETSVMIGDSLEADVQGALDFGMEAIYFNEHKKEIPESILQIRTLHELRNIL